MYRISRNGKPISMEVWAAKELAQHYADTLNSTVQAGDAKYEVEEVPIPGGGHYGTKAGA